MKKEEKKVKKSKENLFDDQKNDISVDTYVDRDDEDIIEPNGMERMVSLLLSGSPCVLCETFLTTSGVKTVFDSVNVIRENISRFGEESMPIYVWRPSMGLIEYDGFGSYLKNDGKPDEEIGDDIISALERVAQKRRSVFVFENPHKWWDDGIFYGAFISAAGAAKINGNHIILVTPPGEPVPAVISRYLTSVEVPLPSRRELKEVLVSIAKVSNIPLPSQKKIDRLVEAALGLTTEEAETAFAYSYIVGKKNFNAKVVSRYKCDYVRRSGIIEIIDPSERMDQVGGLSNLKEFLQVKVAKFSERARERGLSPARGVLLVGVPGCGKSLTAKALASAWKKPLLKFDIGRVFGSFVGQSEANIRRALAMAESVAPCILWIDEIEKGLAGVRSSGVTDSGVTARVVSSFLTWLQEKQSPVFVVATANALDRLPPEMIRKGRFDAIFFVDLPNELERREIFKIALTKRKTNPESYDIETFAKMTEGFSGAEIDHVIESAVELAFIDKDRDVTNEDIIKVIESTRPQSEGMKEQLKALRAWAKQNNALIANSEEMPKLAEPKTEQVVSRQIKKLEKDLSSFIASIDLNDDPSPKR